MTMLKRILLVFLCWCGSASAEIPIGWKASQSHKDIVLIQESHAPTDLESEPARLSRVSRVLEQASLFLVEGHDFSTREYGQNCPDDLTLNQDELFAQVPALEAWRAKVGLPRETIYTLIRAHGDHFFFSPGIDSLTDLGLALNGIAADEINAQTYPVSPAKRLMQQQLARTSSPPAMRFLETFEDRFRAWCESPRRSRAAVINTKATFALERMRVVLARDSALFESWRLRSLSQGETSLRRASACALAAEPCLVREDAPETPADIEAGMDQHRAATLLEGRNAAMARTIDALPPGTSAVVLVGAYHLGDFTHPTIHVTGLLQRLRRLGYVVEPIW